MKLKSGASLKGVQWQMFYASIQVEVVCVRWGVECVITSGTDGSHGLHNATLHPAGLALDYRTRELRTVDVPAFAREVRLILGKDYDVVIESDHLHVEYQPKKVK